MLRILFYSIIVGFILVYTTNIEVFFYDILFIEKNPRINDFLMFFDVTNYFENFNHFIRTSPGFMYNITELGNFRNDSVFVVNVLFSQLYFEIGLVGILIFTIVFFRNKHSRLIPLLVILLFSLNLHNSFFRQQFWIVWAFIILINYNYLVSVRK